MKENKWAHILQPELQKEYYQELQEFLNTEYEMHEVYPPREDIFHALEVTDYDEVKVVILGQDPYHGPGQAHGLSFSVQKGVKQPPSLKNIFKELQSDIGCSIPTHGCLEEWAKQGVLLLNTVLTVRRGEPNSHKGKGWEQFTDEIISLLNNRIEPVIFVLWGKHAEAKKVLITNKQHIILTSPHPSPFSASRGFFGSKPFSKINEELRILGKKEIDWRITE